MVHTTLLMELRRTAELLLRSTPASLTPFLTPAIYLPISRASIGAPRRAFRKSTQPLAISSRRFVSTTARTDQQAAAAVKEEEDVQPTNESQGHSRPQQPQTVERPRSDMSSRTIQTQSQSQPAPPPGLDPLFDPRFAIFEKSKPRSGFMLQRDVDRQQDRTPVKWASFRDLLDKRIDVSSMLTPDYLGTLTPEERKERGDQHFDPIAILPNRPPEADLAAPSFRLGPSLGRTVEVNSQRNMDLGRAFRQLDIKCNQNQVKQDEGRQKFHERPGMKRKRLKAQRWKRTFKAGFQAVVKRVEEMRRKGW